MPFAYFFTFTCLYVAVFAVLCYRTAYSYRRTFIETSGGLSNVFANKVFCGWDFGIVSERAALLNAASLYNEFKELLSEQDKTKTEMSLCVRFGRRLTNLAVTVLVLGFITALQYGLWLLLETNVSSHSEILLSLIVTVVLAVCPFIFNFIVRFEFYARRTSLYVTTARTWLLDMATLAVIFVYWARSGTACWETAVGQEAYRLLLLDCLVSLLLLPAVEFLRIFIYKWKPAGGGPEFNIAYNSLTLVYNQAVVWTGLALCPPLVVALTAKCLLLFYVKRECALRACLPATKVWRAAQTQSVLYMLVTLSLFTISFGLGVLLLGSPSQQCGPFRQYSYVISVVSEGVLRLSHHHTVSRVITFITRPGFIGFFFVALCVCVYWARATSQAQRSSVALLREMIVLQAKDKDFLLAAIANVSQGEWLYSPKAEENLESHTWKYLQEVRKPSNAGFQLDASRHSRSYRERPPSSAHDGDTDSSFSWQGSGNQLHDRAEGRNMI
ncbi:transmembrane channel-like protein 5 isoform X2 [Leptidea sinapis]|nr:transmembrane channel-like protein 5 isoform X2 [Leptidea sinapis]